MNKLFYITFFTFIPISINCQVIDDLEYLESYVISYHDKLLESRVKPHDISKKYNYLNFIPNIGYAYGGVYISYNVYQVAQFFRSNLHTDNQILGLEIQSGLSLQSDLTALRSKYEYCQMLFNRLIQRIEIYDLEKQLFEIKKQEYDNGHMAIEQFINEQISIKRSRQSLDNLMDRIILSIIDLESITNQKINYNMPEY